MEKIIFDLKKGNEIELNEAKIMYAMTNVEKYKDEILVQTVLSDWLKEIETVDDYRNKLDAFLKICSLEELVDLFMQVMRIENINREIINSSVKYELIKDNVYVTGDSALYENMIKNFDPELLKKYRYPDIDYLIEEYYSIINNILYIELSKRAGWKLSDDFSLRNNYFNSKLFKKIEFFYGFKSKLSIIENQLESYDEYGKIRLSK